MKKLLTLCVVIKDQSILLGMKKRGFGQGRWNGFGGKVEAGETVEEAARRELLEEVALVPVEMVQVGIINFTFDNDPKILEVHIFRINKFQGSPSESDEMRPVWFDVGSIPYEQMWSDDAHWLPLLLANKYFLGEFHFDRPSDANYSAKILRQSLTVVDSLQLEKPNIE